MPAGLGRDGRQVLLQLRLPRLAQPQHLAQRGQFDPGGAGVREPQPQHARGAADRGDPPVGQEAQPLRVLLGRHRPERDHPAAGQVGQARRQEVRAPHPARAPGVDEHVVPLQRLPVLVHLRHVEPGRRVADLRRAGRTAALEQPGRAALGGRLQVRQRRVQVVLGQRRQRGQLRQRGRRRRVRVPLAELRYAAQQFQRPPGHRQAVRRFRFGEGEGHRRTPPFEKPCARPCAEPFARPCAGPPPPARKAACASR